MKKIFIIAIISAIALHAKAQEDHSYKSLEKDINEKKTDNSKSILTSLYRAGLNNLLGEDKEFSFKSSFYGLDSIFRKKDRPVSTKREKFLRSNSFNIGLTGDSSNNIKKISAGFTISILNSKDLTLTSFNKNEKVKLDRYIEARSQIRKKALAMRLQEIMKEESKKGTVNEREIYEKNKAAIASWNLYEKSDDITQLDSALVTILNSEGFDGDLNGISTAEIATSRKNILEGKNEANIYFKLLAVSYARKPLWTFSPSFVYDREDKQGEYSFATAFTAGLGKITSKKPWEIELNASYKILNDSSVTGTNYLNKPFSVSLGVNKVLLQNKDDESKMEFKLFTQFDSQTGKMTVTDKNVFTFNSTLRFKIYKSLWLPVTLKYDPDNGNFLGVFSIAANLGD